jgi:hypothetical protein
MHFLKRRRILRKVSALDLIPVRLYQYEENELNRIAILYPRFKNKRISLLFDPGQNKPFIRIRLDHKGSVIWKTIDESIPVSEISKRIFLQYPELFDTLEETGIQITRFISLLYQHKYITFKQFEHGPAAGKA